MEDLSALLSITSSDVEGLLEELEPDNCPDKENVPITFYYIRFQNKLPRLDNFISKLCDQIPAYCLDRKKYQNASVSQYRQIVLEAKQKFAHPSDSKTGEPGELATFFLLEGHLRVPKIFSKMSLKTNPQMHIHGSDGVHLGLDGSFLTLYFGESKVYQSRNSAIRDALESVKGFVSSPAPLTKQVQKDFEINVLSENLDIPAGPLRDRVLRALDPYDRERSNLQYVHACFIGFDLNLLANNCNETDFISIYEKEAKLCYENVVLKIEKDPVLKQLTWHFFFIPFASVSDFRKKFLEELKK